VKLHLVDGTYELYRAHYARRPDHREPSGMDVKATVGIVESLLALLHDPQEAVTHIAVAFDNPIHSFRNDLFPPYKSDEGVPSELRAQFDGAEHAASSIGVTVWSMREYEADMDSRAGLVGFVIRSSKCEFSRRTRILASVYGVTGWSRLTGARKK
jgi:5'-3' exonuclease